MMSDRRNLRKVSSTYELYGAVYFHDYLERFERFVDVLIKKKNYNLLPASISKYDLLRCIHNPRDVAPTENYGIWKSCNGHDGSYEVYVGKIIGKSSQIESFDEDLNKFLSRYKF